MEEWKQIVGFPNYQVSNLGRVRNIATGKIAQVHPSRSVHGYVRISLDRSVLRLHRIVAEAFLEKVEGKDLINHINGDKNDNRASNLEWCNHIENCKHAIEKGLFKTGFKKPTPVMLSKDGIRMTFESISMAAKFLGGGNKDSVSKEIRMCLLDPPARKSVHGYTIKYAQ